ncbi:MAG: hypothetical protein ACJA13_003328 [Paraglaciecola sp.]|jgi:hypothetical protein
MPQNMLRIAHVAQVNDAKQIRLKLSQNSQECELWACFAMGNMALVGDSINQKADKDVHIDGDKINLG